MNSENLIIQSICFTNFIPINKTLIKNLGLTTAIVLSNLIDKYVYFKNNFSNPSGFFLTHQQQCDFLNISEKKLRKCKRELITLGIISTQMKGVPAKEFYQINFDRIEEILNHPPPVENRPALPNREGPALPNREGLIYKEKPNIIKTKILSKDNKEILKKSPKVIKRTRIKTNNRWKSIAIEKWNNIQGPSTHKNLNTKTIKKALDYLEWLTNGKFKTLCKLDPKFCKKQKIPNNINCTQTQVLKIISLYQILWKEGYWPEDKTRLPKSLNNFIFNPRTGTSFFLMLKYNPDLLKPIAENRANTYTSPYLPYFNSIIDNRKSVSDISSALDRLAKWINHNFDQKVLTNYFVLAKGEKGGKFAPFFHKYGVWLMNCDWECDWLIENPKQVFNKWGQVFQDFLKYLNDEYRIKSVGR